MAVMTGYIYIWRDLFFDLNGGPVGKLREMGPRLRGGDGSKGARP